MGVIDVDPILLERSATAALHAAKQADRHMEAEIVGDVDALIETLTPIGPYAYAIKPEIHADGGVHIPIETTREGIHEWYKVIRGESSLLPGWNLVEVRGQWYTFFEAVTRARRRDGDDTVYETETIALLPVTSRSGITGELVWFRVPIASGEADGAAPTAGLAA